MSINAHTHLELSGLPGPIGLETADRPLSMSVWVDRLMRHRRSPEYDIRKAIARGLALSNAAFLGDICQPDAPLEAYGVFPHVRKRLFRELIGWKNIRKNTCQNTWQNTWGDGCKNDRNNAAGNSLIDALIDDADRFLATLRQQGDPALLPGLSPHAPQTVHRELLERAVALADTRHVPVAMHLAESPEEMQLLAEHAGPLAEMMRRVDPTYVPAEVLLGRRPLDYLRLFAASVAGPRRLKIAIIHGNYLDEEEIRFLARNADRFVVVYCPRSHAWFGYREYPLHAMLRAGVRVALGTDGLASSPDLNIMSEADFVRERFPGIPPAEIERMLHENGRFLFDP